jgi:2-amino-4-hydroxy-6-hydroxymethyldihydropteridine diphosphokinase
MSRAWIGLGANLGAREATLRRALEWIQEPMGRVRAVSAWRETEPVDCAPGQPLFLNGAAEVETELGPHALLAALLDIERRLGRNRSSGERNLARTVDLDLLLYDDLILEDATLCLPHPRLHERLFVLEPLAEIAPELVHPVLKRTMRELTSRLLATTDNT